MEESKKYKTIKEFENNCMTAYMKALENKWIKDYKWFERQLKPVGYWTFENVFNAVKDCKNITEVRIKHRYLYKIIKKNNWKSLIFKK